MHFTVWPVLFAACNHDGSDDGCAKVVVDNKLQCAGTETDADTDADSDADTDTPNLDSDGDGLSDTDERNLYGTDPDNPDTDGDGYADGDEVQKYGTSPTSKYSRPYQGDYNVGTCASYPDEDQAHPTDSHFVAGEGTVPLYQPGDSVENVTLLDRYGEAVDLYSFCGRYVDVFFIAGDELTTTQNQALTCWIEDMKNVHSYYRDYGYELFVVLTEDVSGHLPDQDDVDATSALLGLQEVPVLASEDESFDGFHMSMEKDFHTPTLVHIGPDLKVLSVDNDDCPGADRDPCPYMGDWVPNGKCWDDPDDTCEALDRSGPFAYCACPAPACEEYCGECPITY